MVPLRHGKRVATQLLQSELQRAPPTEEKQKDCTSQESVGLMPIGSDVAVKIDYETKEEVTPSNTAPMPSRPTPLSDAAHQRELKMKIHEYQLRKTGGQTTPISLVGSLCAGHIASSLTHLPKASRKIAQAYVDALHKKYAGECGAIPRMKISQPTKPNVDTTQPPSHDEENVLTRTSSKSATPKREDPTELIPSGIVSRLETKGHMPTPHKISPPSHAANAKAGRRSVTGDEEAARELSSIAHYPQKPEEVIVDLSSVVSQIDSVVQELLVSGKLSTKSLSSKLDVDRRSLEANTAELLQNLAILRAHRSSTDGSEPEKLLEPSDIEKVSPVNSFTEAGKTISSKSFHELRARRDKAAIAVRDIAKRLSKLSNDEGLTTLQGIRIQNCRYDGDDDHLELQSSASKGPVTAKKSFSELPMCLTPTMSAWEQDQLKELPFLLKPTFSAAHVTGGQGGTIISADPTGDYTETDFEIKALTPENFTTDVSTLGDDSAIEESKQIVRIERMLRRLQHLKE